MTDLVDLDSPVEEPAERFRKVLGKKLSLSLS
jgi:hypothetical protein